MENIGKKASAKSMGVLNRMDPPHSDKAKAVRMMMDGIEMIMVVAWKKELMTVPMPVKYMWCAQTIKDMKPTNKVAYTIDR